MRQIQLRLPDRLARRLGRRIGPSADPSELLCQLIERGLAQEDGRDARGTPARVTVQLDPIEMEMLERERLKVGLTRAEWIRACLRARLTGRRQFGRQDRGYLRRSVEELKEIRAQVKRLRWSGERQTTRDLSDWAAVQLLTRLEGRLARLAQAIHQGFLGNDAYWRGDDLADGAESAPPPMSAGDEARPPRLAAR